MRSPETQALTDLEGDLPTTREDVEVLRDLRRPAVKEPFEELQALVDQLPESARGPRRSTSEGWEPFKL